MKHYGLYGKPPAQPPLNSVDITRILMGRDREPWGIKVDDGFIAEIYLDPQYPYHKALRLAIWLGMLYERCGYPLTFTVFS